MPERPGRDDQPMDVDGLVGRTDHETAPVSPSSSNAPSQSRPAARRPSSDLGQHRDALVADQRGLDRIRLPLERQDGPGDRLVRQVEPGARPEPPSPAAQPPDAFGRPAPRPRERFGVAIAARRVGRGPRLDQVLDGEAVGAEQPDPLAVGQLERDRPRPSMPVHPEIVERQPLADVLVARAASRCVSIGEWWLNANRPPGRSSRAASGTVRYGSAKVIAPWSQKTMSKRRVRERHGLGAAVDERERRRRPRPSAGGRARAGAPRGRARPAGRRAAPARSTTAPRRSRTRGCPCRRRRRGSAARPRGSATSPRPARRCRPAARRGAPGTRRCSASHDPRLCSACSVSPAQRVRVGRHPRTLAARRRRPRGRTADRPVSAGGARLGLGRLCGDDHDRHRARRPSAGSGRPGRASARSRTAGSTG